MNDWKESRGGERPPWIPDPSPADSERPGSLWATGRIWPVAVAVSLLVVVCVNLGFVYIAVTGADEVVPSYVEEER